MLLVRDKKKPNKEPFEIGEKGFEGLQRKFPGRYAIAGGAIKVTPLGIETIKVTPVKRREPPPKPKREK